MKGLAAGIASLGGAIPLLLVVLAVVGCGSPPADLFVAQRTGSVPGARLKMLVSDGSVRCNGGREREISSQQVLEGRAIAAALENVKQRDIPAARPQIFGYTVRSEWGTIHFADVDQRPTVLPRITRLVRDLAIGVCHLPR